MASNSISVLITSLVIAMMFSMRGVDSLELEVGGNIGWTIPSNKSNQFYNDWASKNRFKVNDTLHFKYSQDSVMAVTDDEYKKCRSDHPAFFSNNGDTVYTLDQPGVFYFISGIAQHCDRGLKMIDKVLGADEAPPLPAANSSHAGDSSSAARAVLRELNALAVVSTSVAGLVFMSF